MINVQHKPAELDAILFALDVASNQETFTVNKLLNPDWQEGQHPSPVELLMKKLEQIQSASEFMEPHKF